MIWNVLLVSWDQLSNGASSLILVHSQLTYGVGWKAGKSLTLCKYCSATAKTSQNYQHHFQYKYKMKPHICYYREKLTLYWKKQPQTGKFVSICSWLLFIILLSWIHLQIISLIIFHRLFQNWNWLDSIPCSLLFEHPCNHVHQCSTTSSFSNGILIMKLLQMFQTFF